MENLCKILLCINESHIGLIIANECRIGLIIAAIKIRLQVY